MNTIIFKSEKKAKNYEVRAAVSFGVYGKGELINRVRTDAIEKLNTDYLPSQIQVLEIK